ncbi:cytidine deaminase [Endomicrobiia bacterium]|uniref:deoxycytidylate deaminase n=1 Tax=Endomicrobium trichonymphae TaxID=1408204 RepID=UPI000865C6DF|nr:dCMP deaminase family protein [Candidatus Endomicrobium trichonymphae]GHT08929.1 cytidine deaminase [Endomicrobiia bacterium]BAV58802.1 deoxycytidylate deaminase [Candidatus Endomicrobium trichonymphae]GHT16836.1 cytidine deaminase [Endomicrobiia bacterium]GHT22942.1 cytidine deaminase [Endomicrobiia bacterium]GMO52158.1 MAG: cytidine/deoxycytidylate deaminase family protein [Candidatus Endomicrobium trichonymphae]
MEKITVRSRPSWDEYFMKLAWLVSERSTCVRHHVGAVIVRDKRILTTGYNGAATDMQDCISLGCLRNTLNILSGQRHEICRAIHAEQNAIIQGGYHGINIKDSTLYCTHSPCVLCAKITVNAGIKRVIANIEYPDNTFKELFSVTGIEFSTLQLDNFSINRLL